MSEHAAERAHRDESIRVTSVGEYAILVNQEIIITTNKLL